MKNDSDHVVTTTHRRLTQPITIALIALLILGIIALRIGRAAERPHWNIEFIPNEVDSVSVNINNEAWTTWQSSQGRVRWYLPDKWANLNQIHVYAAAHPRGKNAHIRVFWDDTERQNMEFDNDEDHDVDKP